MPAGAGGATDPEGGAVPQAGNISICCYCGAINVFTDNLRLRAPSEAELQNLQADPDTWQQILTYQAILAKVRRERRAKYN